MSSKRKSTIQIGAEFSSNNHGDFTVLDIPSYDNITVRFNDTGTVKHGVRGSAILCGKLRDPSKPREEGLYNKYPIGSEWESVNWGKFEIVSIASAKNVTIRWKDTGNVQDGVDTCSIRKGYVVDRAEYNRTYDYLRPKECFHYVYVARLDGRIIYVGHGFGKRYLHCKSGCSHNIELNRLFFNGVDVEVSIHKDGLSKELASVMEKQLIELLEPYCNSRRYVVSF